MKKVLMLIIAFALILGSVPTYAEEASIVVEGENFVSAGAHQVDPTGYASGGYTLVLKGSEATFSITVPDSGFYEVEVRTAGDSNYQPATTLTATLNGQSLVSTIVADGDWGAFENTVLGELEFESGENIITIDSSAWVSLDYIKVTPSRAEVIKADSYTEGENVSFSGEALEMTAGGYAVYDVNFTKDSLYKAEILLVGNVSVTVGNATVNVKAADTENAEAVLSPMFIGSNADTQLTVTANADSSIYRIKIFEATKEELQSLGSVIHVEGETYLTSVDPQVDPHANASGGKSLVMKGEASWNVSVSQAGEYAVTVRTAGSVSFAPQATLMPLTEAATPEGKGTVVKALNEWGDFGETEIGTVNLKAGMNKIIFTHSGSWIAIDKFMLTPAVTEMVPVAAYMGEDLIAGEKTYSRGTDRVELYFNSLVDENSIDNIKMEDESGNEIAVEKIVDKNAVYMQMKETLDYDTNYNIIINGVKSQNGRTMPGEKQYPFTTGSADSDNGKGSLTEVAAEINKNIVSAEGKVLSGENVGISGRIVTVDIKTPKNASVEGFPKEYISGEDGIFEIEEEIPSDGDSGSYKVTVSSEYSVNAAPITLHFISVGDRTAFLGELEGTDTATKVMIKLNTYKTKINIDPTKDFANVSMPMNVYGHFIGASYNEVEDFIADYRKMIAFETLNTATIGSKAEAVLKDEQACAIIGVDKIKSDLIVNERAGFLTDITKIENKATVEEFLPELDKVIVKWIKAEYSIVELTVDDVSKSVKTGQGATLNIGFTVPQNRVKTIEYNITVNDEKILAGAVVEEAAEYEFETEDKTAAAKITADPEAEDVSTWGNILLTAPNATGGYVLTIIGTVTYDIGGYDITENILPADITVTVTGTNSKLPADSSNTSSSSSGRKPSGSTVVPVAPVDPVTPADPVTPPADEEFKFDDIDSVSWAKEGIYALLESGIISENDDKKFNPNNNVTRAQFTKMVIELIGGGQGAVDAVLNDVTGSEWYAQYAKTACSLGIITGDENGNFNADANITRQDMAVILYRTLEYVGKTGDKAEEIFADDGEIAEYAADAVYVMKNLGIINGVGEGKFAPKDNATRAMAAKMIYEFSKAVK